MNKKIKFASAILAAGLILTPISGVVNQYNNVAKAEDNQTPQEILDYMNSEEYKKIEQLELEKAKKMGESVKQQRSGYFWSWQDGLICVTDTVTYGIPHGHAALIAVAPYYYATVEANPGKGVEIVYGSWDTRYKNNHVWQAGVSTTTEAQDHNAAQWAVNQLRKPYNYIFFNTRTRNSFYCSHLVWAAYLDTAGVDLDGKLPNLIHPLELITNGKVIINYYH